MVRKDTGTIEKIIPYGYYDTKEEAKTSGVMRLRNSFVFDRFKVTKNPRNKGFNLSMISRISTSKKVK